MLLLLQDNKMAFFNHKSYKDPGGDGGYYPLTDAMANQGMTIGFHHVLSGKELYFKAFLTSFNETFNSDWASESVFGRTDPIYTFRSTTRKISLNFKAVAESEGEAYENLAKVQRLIQFQYPAYTELEYSNEGNIEKTSANTIAQSPLVRLKMMNFVQKDFEGNLDITENTSLYDTYISYSGASLGLLGFIDSLTINHNLENMDNGSIEKISENGTQGSGATVLPKFIEVSMGFSPIHESPIGWKYDNEKDDIVFMSDTFPYNARLGETEIQNEAFGNTSTSDPDSSLSAQEESAEAAEPAETGQGSTDQGTVITNVIFTQRGF
jgi:hypothetical protein